MAQRVITSMSMAIAMLAIFSFHHVSAQSGCTTTIVSLYPCLNYISGNTSTPSTSCCSTLSSVVKSEPKCLCALLNGGASSFGVTINTTKAMELPPACKVQTPPVSLCKTLGAPAAAPTATPSTETPSTTSTPSISASGASTGSKSTPSTTGESSSAKSNKSAITSVLLLAATALASMI